MVTYPEDSACKRQGEGLTVVRSSGDGFTHALHAVLEHLAEAIPGPESVARLLELLAQELDTSGANVHAVQTLDGGAVALVPHASSGRYDALVRDMPPIELDSSLEAAQVFSERKPHFVGAIHAPDSNSRTGSTSRWRDQIAAHSYATLPLIYAGEPIGVLTLQWSAPVRFDPADRAALTSIATVIAVALATERDERNAASDRDDAAETDTASRREALCIRALGASREEGGRDAESVLVADIEVSGSAAFVFEHSEPDETPVRLLVLAPTPGADEVPTSACMLASAAIGLSGSPAEWLGSLNRALTDEAQAQARGLGVQAWGAAFDARTGTLLEASAGTVSELLTRPDGGEHQAEVKKLPLGLWADEVYPERPQLLLPGDTLEVCIEGEPDLTLRYITRAPL